MINGVNGVNGVNYCLEAKPLNNNSPLANLSFMCININDGILRRRGIIMNTINLLSIGKRATAEVIKPKKQTYNAMYRYTKSINDNTSADTFRKLDNQAKIRLHSRKSALAEQKLLDLSEELCDEPMGAKELLNYFLTQSKNMYNIAKESVLATYYSIKH